MKDKFLPIGTTVMLKGATTPLTIISYCVFPKTKKEEIYEYGGCPYPHGVLDPDEVHAFNHEQIDSILHMGYETEASKELSRILNGGLQIYKQKMTEQASKQQKESEE